MLLIPYKRVQVGNAVHLRPVTDVRVIGRAGRRRYTALIAPEYEHCVVPLGTAQRIGVDLEPDGNDTILWAGQLYPAQFGTVELELSDGNSVWRWRARVAFSSAPIPYAILGRRECLENMTATFIGDQRRVKLETNAQYPGEET